MIDCGDCSSAIDVGDGGAGTGVGGLPIADGLIEGSRRSVVGIETSGERAKVIEFAVDQKSVNGFKGRSGKDDLVTRFPADAGIDDRGRGKSPGSRAGPVVHKGSAVGIAGGVDSIGVDIQTSLQVSDEIAEEESVVQSGSGAIFPKGNSDGAVDASFEDDEDDVFGLAFLEQADAFGAEGASGFSAIRKGEDDGSLRRSRITGRNLNAGSPGFALVQEGEIVFSRSGGHGGRDRNGWSAAGVGEEEIDDLFVGIEVHRICGIGPDVVHELDINESDLSGIGAVGIKGFGHRSSGENIDVGGGGAGVVVNPMINAIGNGGHESSFVIDSAIPWPGIVLASVDDHGRGGKHWRIGQSHECVCFVRVSQTGTDGSNTGKDAWCVGGELVGHDATVGKSTGVNPARIDV